MRQRQNVEVSARRGRVTPSDIRGGFDGIPWEALEALARVSAYGTAKRPGEDPRSWTTSGKDYRAALLRHVAAFESGELTDESGEPALAHIAMNALILLARGEHC